MVKVAFINPQYIGEHGFNRPIRFPTFSYASEVLHPPIALATACAFVREHGFEVDFIDAVAENLSLHDLLERCWDFDPDVAVIETSTPSFYNDLEVARMLHTTRAEVVLVGTHVSVLSEESIRDRSVDAVVIGEYEYSLLDYLRRFDVKFDPAGVPIEGVWYKSAELEKVVKGSRRGFIEDLDSLPFPARDLMPNYKYRDPILREPFTFIVTGRGCPYRCIFCNAPQTMTGHRYRVRSVGNVLAEIKEICTNYRFRSFLFNDDTFTANPRRVMEICDRLIEARRDWFDLEWGCYARADECNERMLRKLRKAGCYLLKVGVESGNQGVLDNMRKGYKLENVRKGVKLMKRLGFHVHATFVFGMPGETEETIRQTIEFAKELDPTTVQFSIGVPYPGTEFYSYLKREGFLLTADWSRYMPLCRIYEYPHLPWEVMREAVSRAYKEFYLQPHVVFRSLRREWRNVGRLIHNAWKVIGL